MLSRYVLEDYLTQLLMQDSVKDYCPNGLQVEGKETIKTIVTGVSANQAFIDAAVAADADAVLVHHGFFFKGDDVCIRGIHYRRIYPLIVNQINLFAFHLPLDLHPIFGNNAQLALRLGIENPCTFRLGGIDGLGWVGELSQPMSPQSLAEQIGERLNRKPMHVGIADSSRLIRKVAWCSGAAQDGIHEAFNLGADAYLSGEISERTVAYAKEYPIDYYACGHHATECDGVRALGQHLSEKFSINHHFIDIENPI